MHVFKLQHIKKALLLVIIENQETNAKGCEWEAGTDNDQWK